MVAPTEPLEDRLARGETVWHWLHDNPEWDEFTLLFISLHLNIGARFPAMLSATGRCFAAVSNFSREELKERFAQLRWEKAPRFEDWLAEVERARVEGVAVDRGNYIRGLTAIATLLPVGPDRRLRGIASIGFEHRMTERTIRQVKDVLIEARQTVASRLQ